MGVWALSRDGTTCGYDGAVIPAGEPVYTVTGTTLHRCATHAPRPLTEADLSALLEGQEREATIEAEAPLPPSQFVARLHGRLPRPVRPKRFTEIADSLPLDPYDR